MNETFFYVDVNSAFISWASVESVLNGGQDYRLIPSVISEEPGVRGAIVAAASQPAKSLGIKVPEHINSALKKCENLTIVKPDFNVYRKWSNSFKELCKKFAKEFESYSIDECVFTVKDEFLKSSEPGQVGIMIRDSIKNLLGFDVTVGIAHTKSFAKIASDFKPGFNVYLITEDNFKEYLWPLPVDRLLYCGPKSTEKLNNNNIFTVEQLANSNIETIQSILGNKAGESLWLQANGLDDSKIVTERPDRKSLSHDTTLQISTSNIKELLPKFYKITSEAITRLKKDNMKTKRVGIKLRDDDFNDKMYFKNLDTVSNDIKIIYNIIMDLLKENYDNKSIRQIGVKFEKLEKE